MNNDSSIERFLELDAGRALGDLTPEEVAEWRKQAELHGESVSEEIAFDDLVTVLEDAMSPDEELPVGLKSKVLDEARSRAPQVPKNSNWIAHPAIGWAVAACFAVALLVQTVGSAGSDPDLVRQIGEESDVIRLQFSRLDATFGNISGEVFWSDDLQKGYMKLAGLTPNDPSDKQFQLWIFDPERDTNPVDGGVFDIAGQGEVIIPIDAKLKVTAPDAFAITVEQPGGVVVSKREVLLALAK